MLRETWKCRQAETCQTSQSFYQNINLPLGSVDAWVQWVFGMLERFEKVFPQAFDFEWVLFNDNIDVPSPESKVFCIKHCFSRTNGLGLSLTILRRVYPRCFVVQEYICLRLKALGHRERQFYLQGYVVQCWDLDYDFLHIGLFVGWSTTRAIEHQDGAESDFQYMAIELTDSKLEKVNSRAWNLEQSQLLILVTSLKVF